MVFEVKSLKITSKILFKAVPSHSGSWLMTVHEKLN